MQEIAISFLQIFRDDIENLNNHTALYANALVKLNQKGLDTENQLSETEKQEVLNIAENIRYYGIRTYTHYQALLKTNLGLKENKTISTEFEKIKTNLLPEYDSVQNYSIEITGMFASLLRNSLEDKSKAYK